MSYTLEDARMEEAYDRLVDDVLATHKDNVIDEYLSKKLLSYYEDNPDLTKPANFLIEEARKILGQSPTASFVLSAASVEVTLRDVILKPVASGLIHHDDVGPLMVDIIIDGGRFTPLLLRILEGYGMDIKKDKRSGSEQPLWNEIQDLRRLRNRIVHGGEPATDGQAQNALQVAELILFSLFPQLRKTIESMV